VKAFRQRLRQPARNPMAPRALAMQGEPNEGERLMFIFNRPLLGVLAALTVPVLLVLLDGVFEFSTI
jgi:hypothetical protein